jgi:hypothetical protein
VDFDTAYDILNKLILTVGRCGGATDWAEIALTTGNTPQQIGEALQVLTQYGMLKPSSAGELSGYVLDADFAESTLQTLVSEGKLTSYSVGGKIRYVTEGEVS